MMVQSGVVGRGGGGLAVRHHAMAGHVGAESVPQMTQMTGGDVSSNVHVRCRCCTGSQTQTSTGPPNKGAPSSLWLGLSPSRPPVPAPGRTGLTVSGVRSVGEPVSMLNDLRASYRWSVPIRAPTRFPARTVTSPRPATQNRPKTTSTLPPLCAALSWLAYAESNVPVLTCLPNEGAALAAGLAHALAATEFALAAAAAGEEAVTFAAAGFAHSLAAAALAAAGSAHSLAAAALAAATHALATHALATLAALADGLDPVHGRLEHGDGAHADRDDPVARVGQHDQKLLADLALGELVRHGPTVSVTQVSPAAQVVTQVMTPAPAT